MDNKDIAANGYNIAVSTYIEQADNSEAVDIKALNAKIAGIVARQAELRQQIDAIVAELEARQRQYEYYRNALLSYKFPSKGGEFTTPSGCACHPSRGGELIAQLQRQAYQYLPITSEAELIANLRYQLEALNKITFSDAEWQRFFSTCIAGANDGIVEKTARIQEDHVQTLERDDGTTKNIYLLDKQNIHNNRLQVINQYEAEGARQPL